LENCIVYGFI